MSDLLAAAAAALGAPEHLVERAAQARATADGTTYEAVLAAWGDGAPLPAAAAPAKTAVPPAQPAAPPPPADVPAAAMPTAMATVGATVTLVQEAPAAAMTAPRLRQETPVLEGGPLHPVRIWLMLAALFMLGLLITLIGPFSTGGDYRHLVPDPAISELGERGRAVYLNQGCGYCHTQLVRPVLADVGLGPVTESYVDAVDTSTFGVHRIGPDLAHVGSRPSYRGGGDPVTTDEFMALLATPEAVIPDGMHPPYGHLSERDLNALATYLTEMK